MNKKRITIGISGASGAVLGIRLIEAIRAEARWESHVVASAAAVRTIAHETGISMRGLSEMCDVLYPIEDVGAAIASGTFETEGMVVIPCSMKTLAGIRSGYSENLLLRAADVTLKERRRLLLVARETPLSRIHLENMLALSTMGAVIMPPMLTFYNHPRSMEEMCTHIVGKVMGEFGMEVDGFRRWGGPHCGAPPMEG